MNFSSVTSLYRLTVALWTTVFAIKLVILGYKHLKTVVSKFSLMTLSVSQLRKLNFHHAPDLAAAALGQKHQSGHQKIQCCFLQKYLLFQSYFVFASQFYSFKMMMNFNLPLICLFCPTQVFIFLMAGSVSPFLFIGSVFVIPSCCFQANKTLQ